MNKLIGHVQNEYSFLSSLGFETAVMTDNGTLLSVINLQNSSGFIFCFTVEKGAFSLAVTTQAILDSVDFGPYSKYFDMVYVTKFLEPSLNFSEINEKLYPIFIKENLGRIISLFDEREIENTLHSLKTITKKYIDSK